MSFASEIKSYLNNIEEEHPCCRNAIESGKKRIQPELVCDRDIVCFIRGVFIKVGFISSPEYSYNLSMTFSDDFMFYVNAILETVGLEAKTGKRRNKYILYYKDSEKIEDFLAFIGASKYALILMEQKVLNGLRGNANRICNAETANLDRMARAAVEQCDAIGILIEKNEFSNLSSELKECAKLRLNNPDMSLDELRSLMKNPISKSGLNHRFTKIIELAKKVKDR